MVVPSDPCAQAQPDVGLTAQRVYVDLPHVDEFTELVVIVQRRRKSTKKFWPKVQGDPRGSEPYLPGLN